MNLPTISAVKRPTSIDDIGRWQDGFAFLGGGTWLFSEPQVHTHTLIDLHTLEWPALHQTDDGLEIAATCRIAELFAFEPPDSWAAGPLIRECCHSFLSSFKVWNEATVGGNIVMSLPAGPMISLSVALEATYTLWPRGAVALTVAAEDFVTGNHANVLAPGELLRSIHIPVAAMTNSFAFRRSSLTHLGRSAVLLIGTRDQSSGAFRLTVTAATARPVVLAFAALPSAQELKATIERTIPVDLYFDDVHGSPAHREHMTFIFAEEIRAELA
jgi:CO/xanthine dehydrogenase FAD-binding subunit